ncbi:UDP-4-amino-4,6-dideoxy-N-acetyl-beta-L-altrosamine transaminase [Granulosicoccus sp.]|nr:UDP-4-amino-4,6-dideoxy-N-acetyl-beta-L-altrosamine transaminase [Granulosicoccus sp.]
MNVRKLPYGRQDINRDDIDAVCRVLESELITQGPVVGQFEHAVAEYCCASHAVAVNSATSALHIACLALNVGEMDTVWTTPNTFVASANCARYCGADIDFVDIDPSTYNMCPKALASRLENAELNGHRLPSVVIVVHFAGQSCDMQVFAELAKRFNFKIIEDASHAVGASYQQHRVGSCVYSDITVFSFHPVKIITSAEGGMALTNCTSLDKKMRLYRNHGVFRPKADNSRDTSEPWSYKQVHLGFNYRMTDVHAALGLSQMQRLDEFVEKRRQVAQHYDEHLAGLPFTLPFQDDCGHSALHLYPILVPETDDVESVRLNLYEFLHNNGLGVNVHYIPVHTQPYYAQLGFRAGDFPVAERYYNRTLSLPIFGSMTDHQQEKVVKLLNKFCDNDFLKIAA